MTTFALSAELPVVHVFLDMAGDAGPPQPDRSRFRLLVAVLALGLAVRAIEGKTGSGVIEIPGLPGTGVVAGFALLAKGGLVLVIFLVTANAGQWRILERRRQVAFFAFHLGMTTRQRITRLVVVKRRILPLLFIVATLTFVAELALVLVILLVTSDARVF